MENNNNNILHSSMIPDGVKSEHTRWDLNIKTEPQDYTFYCGPAIKSEPGSHQQCVPSLLEKDMDEMPQLPVLSSDILDEYLLKGEGGSLRDNSNFNNEDLLSDLMNIVVNGSDYLPDLATCVHEGPATV
ncbi:unnamed protein product [Lymnaea stagnalis]|uniref:Uncharacterized protein n=1 Tax=Lymnaea stagnalis TaxID=6523 RepID=A0AAV2H0N1_LYMST